MSLRGGGREAVEDTPVTGAIDIGDTIADGISNAVPRRISEHLAMGEIVQSVLEEIEHVGYAIVRAEDALTAEQRAAIGRMNSAFEAMRWEQALRPFMSVGGGVNIKWLTANEDATKTAEAVTDEDRTVVRAIAAGGQA